MKRDTIRSVPLTQVCHPSYFYKTAHCSLQVADRSHRTRAACWSGERQELVVWRWG
ncbi:hypothetical protein BDQ12DRAFT_687241 [Crucibulum laeve]|uniref:Uncharacterized protein n=1 Tax=Crucibulum laeve TaxID=68775 RepID=A0A5C3LS87_9AGAR|nr:hypothetical protein BDQ12DRAFT_687241 [Crucibulum laeve]